MTEICNEVRSVNHYALQTLAEDIKINGLKYPILVEPYNKGPEGTKYRVLHGGHRYAACFLNGQTHIECEVIVNNF